MSSKHDARSLRQVVVVRDLQRLASEGSAARAASMLSARQDAQRESERVRTSAEENWRATLSAPSFPLDMALLWSSALLRREEELGRAARDVQGAAGELRRRAADWHAAVSRRDVAEDMARKAEKDRARKGDETALQDALDLHGLRRRDG